MSSIKGSDSYESLIDSVKTMTDLVSTTYKNILEITLESKKHNTAVTELTDLIQAHNQYIDSITANKFCKAPILRVQKMLDNEFAQYVSAIDTESVSQLDAQLTRVCQLAEIYTHKTKFTVMNIPPENLESFD
jgi:ribosome-interacting GTPase 1